MGKYIIIYSLLVLTFVNIKVFASHTFEVEPGMLEMTTSNDYGFVVEDIAEKQIKSKKWLYFCLKEVRGAEKRCFYGEKSDFNTVKTGLKLNGIQYSLQDRIKNKQGRIPLKNASFFYQAVIVRPQI